MRRRAYLHEMLERIPEGELLSVQLFFELLLEPAPGLETEHAAAVAEFLELLRRARKPGDRS